MAENTVILDGTGVKRALTRIAHEVLEKNKGVEGLVLVGIRTGGVHLAHELAAIAELGKRHRQTIAPRAPGTTDAVGIVLGFHG